MENDSISTDIILYHLIYIEKYKIKVDSIITE